MALVIDASSPAGHVTTTQTNTCAAFVPPSDPLLLSLWSADSSAGNVLPSTITSSPAQTWIADAFSAQQFPETGTSQGQAAIWHALPVGSTGSMTISVANWATGGSYLQSFVITGHDPVAPIGVTGGGLQTGGSSFTQTYTGSIDGGQGFLVLTDWSALSMTGVTPATGCSILNKGTIAGAISYLILQRTDPDGVAGGTTTLGVANLVAGGAYRWAYAEVISLAARLASLNTVSGTSPVTARHQAANW